MNIGTKRDSCHHRPIGTSAFGGRPAPLPAPEGRREPTAGSASGRAVTGARAATLGPNGVSIADRETLGTRWLEGTSCRVTELSRHALAGGQEPIAETRQTYDLIASEFARQNSVAAAEIAERLDELAASVPAGSVVADIGCGPGRDVMILRARGLHAAGIDLSLGQLRARDVCGLVQADMRRLPLQAGSVHGIWCWAALVHLPGEAVPRALAEFARIVRSGGRLSMSVAEGDGEGFEVATPYGSDRRRWFTRYREPELTAVVTAAGFSIRNVRRHRAYRDWLSVRATREPAGANGF